MFVLSTPSQAQALTPPNFPTCVNPEGQIKIEYTDGQHAIVGKYDGTVNGHDTVYTLNESSLTQCLCTVDGVGTQTNWWKVSSITDDDRKLLENSGWYYIPDGSQWGLEATPYMAFNTTYSCLVQTNSNNSSSNSSNSSSSNSSNNSSNSNSTSGQILAATTDGDVLGLSTTGNSLLLLVAILATLVSFVATVVTDPKRNQKLHPNL